MPSADEVINAINEFVVATYIKKDTKTLLANTLEIIRNNSNKKEAIILDIFISAIDMPYIKSEDRCIMRIWKEKLIKIINKYEETFIDESTDENNSDEDSFEGLSNNEIAKTLVKLREQEQLEITNGKKLQLNNNCHNNEACLIC